MYTAKLIKIDVQKEAQRTNIEVELSNGTDTFVKQFPFAPGVTTSDIKFRVKAYIAELENSDIEISKITIGDLDLSTTIIDLTTEEEEKQTWQQNLVKLQGVQELITLGVVSETHPKVIALREVVRTTLKTEYINLI